MFVNGVLFILALIYSFVFYNVQWGLTLYGNKVGAHHKEHQKSEIV